MAKQLITIEQAVEDLKKIFDLTGDEAKNHHGSRYGENKFYIQKVQMQRMEVVVRLQQYFEDKIIKGGFCWIAPITFVFTTFEIYAGIVCFACNWKGQIEDLLPGNLCPNCNDEIH